MPSRVFEFSAEAEIKQEKDHQEKISYELIYAKQKSLDASHPILILQDRAATMVGHTCGSFGFREKELFFCYGKASDQLFSHPLRIDARFEELIRWLADDKSNLRLTGEQTREGYAVYAMRSVDASGRNLLVNEDAFLQLVIERLLFAPAPEKEKGELEGKQKKQISLNDMSSIENFLRTASHTLPKEARDWAWRNLSLTRSHALSQEERRHAQRALSLMLSVSWESDYFPSIDPVKARAILDENLYGMEKVKQRIIETVIQINRTHTLPAYGLLLAGPAGVGKSQIAYAVARILSLPWTSLDMSTISDAEALTGSPRVYGNAKPGRIMEAFAEAKSSNLVFIINELDKAKAGSGNHPADALLTLLDNLGFTDNYMECMIPTTGVYPIATANDKSQISEPLMTRFAVIDIPDYTTEEKKHIFREFSLPKVLDRMAMRPEELVITDAALDRLVEIYADLPGVRDLEQAAEHLAANALYQIETMGKSCVRFDRLELETLLMS